MFMKNIVCVYIVLNVCVYNMNECFHIFECVSVHMSVCTPISQL